MLQIEGYYNIKNMEDDYSNLDVYDLTEIDPLEGDDEIDFDSDY